MPSSLRRSLPITGVVVILTAALASADIAAGAAPRVRVRPETADAQSLLDELTARSATGRALVESLERSDLLVYIRHRIFTSSLLDGRIGIVRSGGPQRYLIVELACGRTRSTQLVTLGHELKHASEIAEAPAVIDARTLSAHYGRIGMRLNGPTEWEMFETQAAIDVSTKVRRELFAAMRTTHDRD